MRVEFEQRHVDQERVLLRVAVTQRNLIAMLVKLEDPTSARHIIGRDVRVYTQGKRPEEYFWAYDQAGWVMHLRGLERQDLHHSVGVAVDSNRRVVTLAVDRQGVRQLLAQARDGETNPFDQSVPVVIVESDDYHYGSRGLGPGMMVARHEAKIQDLGAMPGEIRNFSSPEQADEADD